MHGLQAVAHVGQRAVHDRRQRVGEVALFERVLQVDRLDAVGAGQNRFVAHGGWASAARRRRQAPGCGYSCPPSTFETAPITRGLPCTAVLALGDFVTQRAWGKGGWLADRPVTIGLARICTNDMPPGSSAITATPSVVATGWCTRTAAGPPQMSVSMPYPDLPGPASLKTPIAATTAGPSAAAFQHDRSACRSRYQLRERQARRRAP